MAIFSETRTTRRTSSAPAPAVSLLERKVVRLNATPALARVEAPMSPSSQSSTPLLSNFVDSFKELESYKYVNLLCR